MAFVAFLTIQVIIKKGFFERKLILYAVEIKGPGKDLHSGVFGGTVHEPMTDLVHLMSKLVDTKGKILIPGVYDSVAAVTGKSAKHFDADVMIKLASADEHKIYEALDFNMSDIYGAIDAENTIYDQEKETLMARSVYGLSWITVTDRLLLDGDSLHYPFTALKVHFTPLGRKRSFLPK